jgi:hypothetical protein
MGKNVCFPQFVDQENSLLGEYGLWEYKVRVSSLLMEDDRGKDGKEGGAGMFSLSPKKLVNRALTGLRQGCG